MSAKGKGSQFERDISRFFSIWLTGKDKPLQYWRQPQSGGLATIHEENVDLSGDIRALTREAEFLTSAFSIECKVGYPTTSFWQHFTNIKTFNVRNFWKQCIEDAQKGNKEPMLIYRKKHKAEIVGTRVGLFDIPHLGSITIEFIMEKEGLPSVKFYNMKDFFKEITPEIMKEKFNG